MPIRNTPATDAVVDKEEAGAVDNRLSLVPSDFPFTEDWQDGEEYPGEIDGHKVIFRQISPGESEVIPGESVRQEAAEEEASPTPKRSGYRNKAVEDMANEI